MIGKRIRGWMWGAVFAAFWRGRNTPADSRPRFATIIRGGTVYDGSGAAPFVADIGINAGRIDAIGDLSLARASEEIDAIGLAVAPGFHQHALLGH